MNKDSTWKERINTNEVEKDIGTIKRRVKIDPLEHQS